MAQRQGASECRCARSGSWGRSAQCEEPGYLVFAEEASMEPGFEEGGLVQTRVV